MNPLKRKIEERALNTLRNIISTHPTMEGYFNERDKELSWDGYIRIYQKADSSSDKSNYDDDVPIQIKGHLDRNRKYMVRERITSSLGLDDLRVYYRRTGCLYFIIYMNEDGTEASIFYSSLYPSKIKRFLEEAVHKGNTSSITIPFIRLRNDSEELYLLCKQFSTEIRKQGSGLGQIVSRSITGEKLRDVKTIKATTAGKTPYDLLKGINTGDVVLYGIVDDSGIEYPMQVSQIVASMKDRIEASICIGEEQYYSSFEIETTVTGPDVKGYKRDLNRITRISPNLSLFFSEKNVNFTFKYITDLMQLKHDARFLLNLINGREVFVNGGKITFGKVNIDSAFLEQLEDMVEVGQALEDVRCNIFIPFKELTVDDKKQIDTLAAIRAEKITFNIEQDIFQYIWTFRGKKWPIIVNRKEHRIYSYLFDTNIIYSLGSTNGQTAECLQDDAYIVPNFIGVEADLLANLYYYDYESIYEQIDRSVINEITVDELNTLSLNLIKAYDINGDDRLLDAAEEILKRLRMAFPNVIYYPVNLLQIEVRKSGKLSDDGMRLLNEWSHTEFEKPEDDQHPDIGHIFTYCSAVLKGEKDDADSVYAELTAADKEGVDDWPIRTLHIRMKSRYCGSKED